MWPDHVRCSHSNIFQPYVYRTNAKLSIPESFSGDGFSFRSHFPGSGGGGSRSVPLWRVVFEDFSGDRNLSLRIQYLFLSVFQFGNTYFRFLPLGPFRTNVKHRQVLSWFQRFRAETASARLWFREIQKGIKYLHDYRHDWASVDLS